MHIVYGKKRALGNMEGEGGSQVEVAQPVNLKESPLGQGKVLKL